MDCLSWLRCGLVVSMYAMWVCCCFVVCYTVIQILQVVSVSQHYTSECLGPLHRPLHQVWEEDWALSLLHNHMIYFKLITSVWHELIVCHCRTYFLDPRDPLFNTIGSAFIKEVRYSIVWSIAWLIMVLLLYTLARVQPQIINQPFPPVVWWLTIYHSFPMGILCCYFLLIFFFFLQCGYRWMKLLGQTMCTAAIPSTRWPLSAPTRTTFPPWAQPSSLPWPLSTHRLCGQSIMFVCVVKSVFISCLLISFSCLRIAFQFFMFSIFSN